MRFYFHGKMSRLLFIPGVLGNVSAITSRVDVVSVFVVYYGYKKESAYLALTLGARRCLVAKLSIGGFF